MKTKKILIIVCIFVLIYFVGGIVYSFTRKEFNAIEKEEATIKGYNYIMLTKDLSIFKDEYKILKKNLENENIDYLEYAKSISKLFVCDLYTLSNKVSSSDIGGVEFVYKDFKKDFISIAKTTLYNSVKSNLYGDRIQELPTVTNVTVEEIKATKFKYGKTEFADAYNIKLNIEYEKDLGYVKNCELVLINNENILEIVKLG